MTNFESVAHEEVATYLKGKDLSKLSTVLDLYQWSVRFIKHLSQIRTKETSVNAVMKAVQKESGDYWEEWVKPAFADVAK
jgi:hypothetical protein